MKCLLLFTIALTLPGSLLAQSSVVDTMASLRGLAAPTATGTEATLRGYHQLGDNTPQTYRWNTTSTAADDGGAVINPNQHPGAGRWLLVWDGVTANVRSWGAYFVPNAYAADAAHDSLPAINAATNALPSSPNDNCEQPAGTTGTYHGHCGKLYFPGGGVSQGYVVSGEIFCTAYMRVLGDGSAASLIVLLPGVATDATNPRYVIHYLYNNGPGSTNPNENFETGVWGISVGAAANNAGASGIKFLGSNNTYLIDATASVPLESFRIDSKGVYFDRLMTGSVSRGPGLEITGSEVTGGYADIEHVNFPSASGFARDAANILYPAVWIHDTEAFSIGTIATESSPLSVRITNAQFGVIDTIHANPNTQIYGTVPTDAVVTQLDGTTDGISILSTVQGPTSGLTSVVDTSMGLVNGALLARAVNYTPAAARGSYCQDLNVFNETLSSLVLNGYLTFGSVGPASAYNFVVYQNGDAAAIGYRTAQSGSVTGLVAFDTGGNLVPMNTTAGMGNGSQPWKTIYANTFYGSGAGLTNIPASAIAGLAAASVGSQPTVYESGNYAVQDADRGTRQVYSSATIGALVTLGTPSATAFANGWYFLASNTGSVPMTLQAPAGRTIDGQTSLSLPPRTQAVITSDGTNYFSSLAGSGGERLIDFYELSQDAASVSFTIPPGFHHLHLLSDCVTTASLPTVLLAQFNGDANPSDYTRNSVTVENGSLSAGLDTSNPGMYVGSMNDPSAPGPAQNDAVISLGGTTPSLSRPVSAMTNASAYLGGSSALVNNASQWIPPGLYSLPATILKVTNSRLVANVGAKFRPVPNTMTLQGAAGNIAAGSTLYLYGY